VSKKEASEPGSIPRPLASDSGFRSGKKAAARPTIGRILAQRLLPTDPPAAIYDTLARATPFSSLMKFRFGLNCIY